MNKPAALLALAVGAMSIVAGGMVIRGWRPGYSVLSWLPVYNFAIGLLTLAPAYLLWTNNRYALAASIATFALHTMVFLLLLTVFRNDAALQSLGAMGFRVLIWAIILALIWFKGWKKAF
ncbi:MAG: hypothetical protein DPW18_20170 [Chloroflexi bacterium]|nr:hypothetical protein [Chloroflexota bacterium]MDL1941661.1 hypothetical protein [Chloroflexi bacterium CFX2]